MSQNTSPVFGKVPNVGIKAVITAANNTLDLTSGTSYDLWTAGTNGSYLRDIQIKANPANNTAGTVARIWIVRGSKAVAANAVLYKEIGIAATTATATAAQADFNIPVERAMQAGDIISLTLGTAPGGSGEFSALAFGMDF